MSHGEPTRFAALGLRDEPDDEQLVSLLRPPDWVNPEPAARYDLVVLGGGTAGLVAAAGSAGLGARVALIEAALLGGDCLVTGCIPSKTLLRGAATPNANFEDVMRRVRAVRAEIAPHDSAQRFRDELGVDVFFGRGRFVSRRGLEVDGTPIAFRRALIATGARPTIPAIQGLDTVPFLTSETVFSLETLPARLAILGAGPIGCELAQAFARLGSAVTLIEEGPRILPRDDPDAVQCLAAQFENEGIAMQTQTRLVRVSSASGGIRLELEGRGAPTQLEVERLLVAVGRTPHVEGLGLEAAGVTTAPSGIEVDARLRTRNRRIFAAGDVCLEAKFTHAADLAARTVVRNALFFGRRRFNAASIPRSTYTDPEIAHLGLGPLDSKLAGQETQTFTRHFADVDRARTEGDTRGFVRIHVRRGSDRIVGATIVGPHAGDLISEIGVAMAGGVGLARLSEIVHPYPTRAEAIRQCGDEYNRTRLTPFVRRLFSAILRLQT